MGKSPEIHLKYREEEYKVIFEKEFPYQEECDKCKVIGEFPEEYYFISILNRFDREISTGRAFDLRLVEEEGLKAFVKRAKIVLQEELRQQKPETRDHLGVGK